MHTRKKAKIGGKKPSGIMLPKPNINMSGPSSILSCCGKQKSTYRLCKVYKVSAGGIKGKKTLLKQIKISSKDDDHCDNVSVSKQECIVDPSSQVSDNSPSTENIMLFKVQWGYLFAIAKMYNVQFNLK